MVIEGTGRPEGGLDPNAVGTAGDMSQAQGPMSTVDRAGDFELVDGQKVPKADVVEAYKNMQKWRGNLSQRGEALNQREVYLRDLEERLAPLANLDEAVFKNHPGSEERLKQFVASKQFLYGTEDHPGEAPSQFKSPDGVTKADLEALKAEFAEREMDRDINLSWRDFRGSHPDLKRHEEFAVRGAIGMLDPRGKSNLDLLEEGLRIVRYAAQEAGQQQVTDIHQQARMNALGNSTIGMGPGGRRDTANWDPHQHSMEDNEAEAKRRLLAGEYGSLE